MVGQFTAKRYTNLWAINLPANMKGCKLLLKPLSEISGLPQGVFAFLLHSAETNRFGVDYFGRGDCATIFIMLMNGV